ncbi:MAG: hypothetical protein EOP84_03925 [Verrucomicrobiaceae bacterium]|nr:MAG: hypothetical protein EOP84_03925 [Verrucomicrobiaceae bacterium]
MSRTWILSTTVAVPLAIGCLYAAGIFFGMAGGQTWTIGYYGKFNRVRKIIEKMPDVRITDSWQHHDITLEDFGFTIIAPSGALAKADFFENSPQMSFTRAEDIEAFVRTSQAK